jgi:hypothetical protein
MEVVQGPTTPPVEPPPGTGDCKDEVAAAIAARDQQWQDWLTEGSPSDE